MSIVGKWKLTVTTPMGTQTPTLTLNEDGSGSFNGQMGSAPLADCKIDGDSATYNVSFSAMGRDITLKCNAKAEGDKLTGSMDTPMGSAQFTGERL